MRPPQGKASNVEVLEVAPHEFLLEPNHPYTEIRGTKYFESGSKTLLDLSKYVQSTYHSMPGTHRSSHDPGCLLITGMFTNIKYNSGDVLSFIQEKQELWASLGYRISNMPPKLPHKHRERKLSPEHRHNLRFSTSPSISYAFIGANTQDTKMALACALVEAGLISAIEVSADGKTIGWFKPIGDKS